MKPPRKRNKTADPIQVKSGSAIVKIYPIQNRGRTLYTVTHYAAAGQRRRQNFADLAKAKAEAHRLAANLQKGDIEAFKLSNKDRSAYLHALAEIGPTGRSLEIAASEFAGAIKLLGHQTSLVREMPARQTRWNAAEL
jgi:hypothetical protein